MNNKAKQQWDKRAAECSNLFKVVKTGKVQYAQTLQRL